MAKTITNPFTPVVGKVPPHIAGREEIIADVEAALAGTGNDPANCRHRRHIVRAMRHAGGMRHGKLRECNQ